MNTDELLIYQTNQYNLLVSKLSRQMNIDGYPYKIKITMEDRLTGDRDTRIYSILPSREEPMGLSVEAKPDSVALSIFPIGLSVHLSYGNAMELGEDLIRQCSEMLN